MQCLVSGGTGTFGRAFVSRLLDGNLSQRICIYSRGEHPQAQMREELADLGGKTPADMLRNPEGQRAVEQVLERMRGGLPA